MLKDRAQWDWDTYYDCWWRCWYWFRVSVLKTGCMQCMQQHIPWDVARLHQSCLHKALTRACSAFQDTLMSDNWPIILLGRLIVCVFVVVVVVVVEVECRWPQTNCWPRPRTGDRLDLESCGFKIGPKWWQPYASLGRGNLQNRPYG